MAIHFWEINKLVSELKSRRETNRPAQVLSLGHPTLNILENDLKELVGAETFEKLKPLNTDPITLKRHDKTGLIKTFYCPRSLIEAFGGELHVMDVKAWEGYEIVADLNGEISPDLKNRFDIVVDPGTLEHCFHVSKAIWNISSCVKVGGLVIHNNPLTMVNHGFYNLNPEFYDGFYSANGFQVEDLLTVIPDKNRFTLHKTKTHGRIYPALKENKTVHLSLKERAQAFAQKSIDIEEPLKKILSQMIFASARKITQNHQPTWPTQKKYK